MLYDQNVKVTKNIVSNILIKKHFNWFVKQIGGVAYSKLKIDIKKLIDDYFYNNPDKRMKVRYLVPSDWTGTPVDIIWITLSTKYGTGKEIVEIAGGVLGAVARDCMMDSTDEYYEMGYDNESGYSYAKN